MKIAVASDHAGFDLKTGIVAFLEGRGIAYRDFGSGPGETVDYVDYGALAMESVISGECDRAILFCGTGIGMAIVGALAMESVISGECDRAILFCGTGIGMAIVGNKYKGIRAATCWNPFTARVSRSHNDSNCLALGGRTLSLEEGIEIVRTWLETPFEGGRHQRRVAKILEIEKNNFKP